MLYRGLSLSLLGIPHIVVQFNLYESFKQFFSKKLNTEDIPMKIILFTSLTSKSKIFQLKYIFSYCKCYHISFRCNLEQHAKYKRL
jgi:hypothetical protein